MRKFKNKFMNIIVYTCSVYLGQFFKGVSSIFLSGFLGPIGRGQYSYVNLYYQYLQYANLGVRYSTDKNLPLIYDEGNQNEINDYELKAKSSLFILQLIISILVSLFIILFEKREIKGLLLVTVLSSLFYYINEFYKAIYRAEQKVSEISKYTILYYSITGIVQLISVYFFKLNGAIYSILICNILFYIIFFKKIKLKDIKIDVDFKFMIFMVKDGFVLFMNALTVFTIMNLDKFFVIAFSPNKDFDLGLYTFATMFFGMFQILPTCITEVLFPDLLIRIKKNSKEEVGIYIFNSIKTLSKVFYVIIGLSIMFYPVFVHIFMKDYITSINLFQIIIIGIFLIAIQALCSYVLIGIDKKSKVLSISLISLLISIIINFLGIKLLGFSLIEIAFVSASTYFVYSFIYLIIIYREFRDIIKRFPIELLFDFAKLVLLIFLNVSIGCSLIINSIFFIDIMLVGYKMIKKIGIDKKIFA